MRVLLLILSALSLSACASVTPQLGEDSAQVQLLDASLPSPQRAADNFLAVVDRVEPIAERICRAEAPALTCDYQFVVDSRPIEPPNAFQTLDRAGRPIIAFTISLIADARNQDELAFILGHEAAHHIAGHLQKTQATAQRGALLAGALAAINGAEEAAIRAAQEAGATVGARAFSKEFELEADAMGAVIAYRAGFDPLIGAKYFERIEDPGNRFLGTHPPNADRIETVRRTVESLR